MAVARWNTILAASMVLAASSCMAGDAGDDTVTPPPPPPTNPPPPPPAGPPPPPADALTLTVFPLTRSVTVQSGAAVTLDSVALAFTGDGRATAGWNAAARQPRTALTTAFGHGDGRVRWRRETAGLAPGLYVDTITVTAPGALGAPVTVIDSLRITALPVPLTLSISPAGRHVTAEVGTALPSDSASVTLQGDGATATAWQATKRRTTTTLTTAAGTGSGLLRWGRTPVGLAAGTYVDTITVTAGDAIARVIDTVTLTPIVVVPPPPPPPPPPLPPPPPPPPAGAPVLGLNGSFQGRLIFPANDLWNRPVDTAQVDPNSAAILGAIGLDRNLHPDFGANWNGGPFGIPYIVVADATARSVVAFEYDDESDPGPYPIPANPPIEPGGGDQHLLVVTQGELRLYELFYLQRSGSQWTAGSGAIFDIVNGTTRPAGWTSADAAGLPILPGLVRYDEVYEQGEIRHALRFTLRQTRRAYIAPARHWASSSTNPLHAPMGMRVRLKASFDISGYPARAQVILRALKTYGMIVADNGSDFFLSGTADARWNDAVNNTLKQVRVRDFEVVRMQGVVTP